MITLSIIVPTYNDELYLNKCIDSILSQSYRDFELIIVNDGSTDKSSKIINKYARKDNRIKLVNHTSNLGVSRSRNDGLILSNGEWVTFVDSDDILPDGALDILMSTTKYDCKMGMCGFERYNSNGKCTFSVSDKHSKVISQKDAMLQMFKPNTPYFYQGFVFGKLYNNNVIKSNNIQFAEDIKCNEDRLFNVMYLSCIPNGSVYQTDKVAYKYYINDDSVFGNCKRDKSSISEYYAAVRMRPYVLMNNKELDYESACLIYKLYKRYQRILSIKDIKLKSKLFFSMIHNVGIKNLILILIRHDIII